MSLINSTFKAGQWVSLLSEEGYVYVSKVIDYSSNLDNTVRVYVYPYIYKPFEDDKQNSNYFEISFSRDENLMATSEVFGKLGIHEFLKKEDIRTEEPLIDNVLSILSGFIEDGGELRDGRKLLNVGIEDRKFYYTFKESYIGVYSEDYFTFNFTKLGFFFVISCIEGEFTPIFSAFEDVIVENEVIAETMQDAINITSQLNRSLKNQD